MCLALSESSTQQMQRDSLELWRASAWGRGRDRLWEEGVYDDHTGPPPRAPKTRIELGVSSHKAEILSYIVCTSPGSVHSRCT